MSGAAVRADAPGAGASARHREVGRRTIGDAIAGLERLRDSLGDSFEAAAGLLVQLQGKVITLGVGKSGHAARKTAATLRSVGVPALYLNASDSLHGDLGMMSEGDVAMLFSKSGATRELVALTPHLRSRQVVLVAVTGTPDGVLGREADITLDVSVEREGCPLDAAPMASILAAQAIGDALAAAVARARGFTVEDFARLHPGGTLGARLTLVVGDVMRRGNELPTVPETGTMREAIIEITRTGYGAVCVLAADQRLVGLITDGDVRRTLLGTDRAGDVPVAEVMTRSPMTVSPETPLSQALLLLEQRPKAFMTAPVVDGARCVGLLRLHDAVQAHLPP